MRCLKIGLTGGIASGKSLVQQAFENLGVAVLDADQVSRIVVEPGQPALQAIAETFGAEMLLPDGQLDRRRMRERVFSDPAARKRLESITHPAIRHYLQTWLAAQTGPYCLLSVAILVEAGMQTLVDRVLVVDVPESLQLSRLQQRDGIDPTLAKGMLAAQASRDARLQAANDVLENTGSPEQTEAAVRQLHHFYLNLAENSTPHAPGLRLPHSVI
jgi:dephospho-CoA kinase